MLTQVHQAENGDHHADSLSIQRLEVSFRAMCNEAIRIVLAADASPLKRLSNLTCGILKEYDDIPSYYRLCAISKATGNPTSRCPEVVSCKVDATEPPIAFFRAKV